MHQPLGTPLLLTSSFSRGHLSSQLSRLATGVSFDQISFASSAHPGLLNSALAIRAFFRRRKELRDLDADFIHSNYWRLVALASFDYIFTIPMASWNISLGVSWGRLSPWVSWDDTHWGYSRVFQYPRILMNPVEVLSLEVTRWMPIFCAFAFFGFFGFADEAKKNYRLLASTLAKLLGHTVFAEGVTTSAPGVDMSLHFAPGTSATQQTESRRDSDSFSDKLSVSTTINESDPKFQPLSSVEQPTSFGSSSPRVYMAPQVPEPVFELPLRRPVPDDTRPIRLGDALDQV